MASKSRSRSTGNIPWAVVIPIIHAAVDLATNARCPDCQNQVVLYVCFNCKKPVRPSRGSAAA